MASRASQCFGQMIGMFKTVRRINATGWQGVLGWLALKHRYFVLFMELMYSLFVLAGREGGRNGLRRRGFRGYLPLRLGKYTCNGSIYMGRPMMGR